MFFFWLSSMIDSTCEVGLLAKKKKCEVGLCMSVERGLDRWGYLLIFNI